MTSFTTSRQLLAEAARQLPGGVNSNYRLGISPTPLVFDRAEGAFLYDVDGNRLIDYYLGMGPMILGHSPAAVIAAVTEQLQRGILFAGQSGPQVELLGGTTSLQTSLYHNKSSGSIGRRRYWYGKRARLALHRPAVSISTTPAAIGM